MAQFKRFTPLVLSIAAAIVIQLIFVAVDRRDTPNKAVIEFSKAYFMLSPCMADRLCKDQQTVGDVDAVAYYLSRVAHRAEKRGFSSDFMKTKLYHVKTTTLKRDETTAEIHLHGMRRFAMNPLYDLVSRLFGFSKPQVVDVVVTVRKEEGQWKVCGEPFGLSA